MTQITLVRHGTTEWMEKGLMHGRSDAPLSVVGKKQVEEAAETLRHWHFDAFYSSPTGRAVQTARIIEQAIKMPFKTLDGLMEIDFGTREGKPAPAISTNPLGIRFYLAYLGISRAKGESLRQLENRVSNTLTSICEAHPQEKVLVVTHHGVINALLGIVNQKRFTFYRINPAQIIDLTIDT